MRNPYLEEGRIGERGLRTAAFADVTIKLAKAMIGGNTSVLEKFGGHQTLLHKLKIDHIADYLTPPVGHNLR